MTNATSVLVVVVLCLGCGNGPTVGPLPERSGHSRGGLAGDSTDRGYVGVVAPKRTAVVAADISARIERVFVRMGDTVAKDAPIVSLDGQSIRDELTSARAVAAAARAASQQAGLDVANSRREHSVERRLNQQGVSSSETVRAAKITLQKSVAVRSQMAAEARRAQADVDRLERALADSTLRAPIAGVVSLLRAREGDMVRAGQNVVRVLAPGDWQLRFAVPAKDAGDLKPGQRVSFAVGSSAHVALDATVRHVAPELEPPLQLVVVEAEFDADSNGADVLRAGKVGRVRYAKAAPQADKDGS